MVRQIPDLPYCDGMIRYPLFACQDRSKFYFDLKDIENDLVSLTLVDDP